MAMYRCYGMMDARGRWRSWLFAPCAAAERARLITEAAAAGHVLFASAQAFAPPRNMAGRTRWNVVKQQYVGDSGLGVAQK